jgi:inner membrane protein
MRGPTHALAGACTAGLFLTFAIPHQYPLLALSAVSGFAALLPDLDNTESTIENIRFGGYRLLKGPAFIIDKLFKHRGFLHSLLSVALLAFVLLGFLPQIPIEIHITILLGYVSHLVTDSMTPEGIPWFYPWEFRATLLPKILCVTTGSFMETLVFVGLIVLYAIFLASAGYIILPTS